MGILIQCKTGDTSTGNETGIIFNYNANKGNAEVVASGTQYTSTLPWSNYINKKYYDYYYYADGNLNVRVGEATVETNGWHGSTTGNLLTSANAVYTRTFKSIFAYTTVSANEDSNYWAPYARAAVVCGEGI